MGDESSTSHTKPDASMGNFNITSGHQLFVTNADCIGQQNMHNVLLWGKPLKDLASILATMAGFNRPLVVISQEQGETEYSHPNEADTPWGVASKNIFEIPHMSGLVTNSSAQSPLPVGVNRTAELKNINNLISAVPTNSTVPSDDLSLAFYQQQVMLKHQMFLQQQQTVNALIGKVNGLTK